jgi:hypothetical protein
MLNSVCSGVASYSYYGVSPHFLLVLDSVNRFCQPILHFLFPSGYDFPMAIGHSQHVLTLSSMCNGVFAVHCAVLPIPFGFPE